MAEMFPREDRFYKSQSITRFQFLLLPRKSSNLYFLFPTTFPRYKEFQTQRDSSNICQHPTQLLENFLSAHCLCARNCSKHLIATHPMRQDNNSISKMKKLRCRKVKGTQLRSAELEFKPRSLCSYPLGYNPQGFRPKSLCPAQLHQSLSS